MSQAHPFQPNLHPDDEQGIPAADPGPGAPPTAPGFGEGYEPSEYDDEEAQDEGSDDRESDDEDVPGKDDEPSGTEANVFEPPDPDDVRRDGASSE
ncbi:hypothetical protein GCM10023169_21690 [Georgenia halophila]|uniref:Uncharacterized protein n=1 Tax=Georgenia halophila TaxID=620889 RepID=A0ABP8L8D3_9MICO